MIKKKIDKKITLMNETRAFNLQLRSTINKKRKEREIFDGIYTQIEKDIMAKEKTLTKLIEKRRHTEHELDQKKQEYSNKQSKSRKEQDNFEQNYSQLILGINDSTGVREAARGRRSALDGGGGLESENQAELGSEIDEEIFMSEITKMSKKQLLKIKEEEEQLVKNQSRIEEVSAEIE